MTTESAPPPDEGLDGDRSTEPQEHVLLRETLRKLQEGDPVQLAREILEAHRKVRRYQAGCRQAEHAAAALQTMIEDLLGPKSHLYRLDRLVSDAGGNWAVVTIGGVPRVLPVHPDADLEALRSLEPWEYVRVHPGELIVQGAYRDESLWSRSLGEVVSFQGYHDQAEGLVRVKREGRDETVVRLSEHLRERETLVVGDRLVMMRDDEHLAIERLPADCAESRYEMQVSGIRTRLRDLAGVDQIVSRLLEDLLLRLVARETQQLFDLDPLNGMILYSYKAGMGKTTLARAIARWLYDLGQERGFDVGLFHVKPNSLKSMWHGQDAHNVRVELCGAIRARLNQPRERPLFLLIVFDEVESLGRRNGEPGSAAGSDAVQALLAEMDGMEQLNTSGDPPAHCLWIGLTNRPELLDEALKRPGRMGDLVLEMPDYDEDAAERILGVHTHGASPWYLEDRIRADLTPEELGRGILRPALARVFPLTVLRYWTEATSSFDATAGQLMAGVHYKNAINSAKRRAAVRSMRGDGVPAVTADDVVECLLSEACGLARQMEADRQMLARHVGVRKPIVRVEVIEQRELATHRFLRAV